MGISSSLSGVSFSGIGSGIDTQSIVQRLMQVESFPLNRLQQQKGLLEARKSAYSALKDRLQSLASAAGALNAPSAFNPVSASSSKTDVATVSAGTGATAGVYNLTVSKLAQSHKISSSAQTDATSALNLSGRFTVNGRGVSIAATDSLTAIAQKINATQSGVTASIINGGTGQAYLTMTANQTGESTKIQIGDLTGTIAQGLGLANGVASIRQAITNGAASASFSASTTAMSTVLGATGLSATSFDINGTTINVNLETMSLQDIANAINTAGAGATATVKSVTEGSSTRYRLEIVGNSGTPSFTDTNGTLAALGVLQKGFGNQLVAAQKATFTIDGISFTNDSNTVTSVLPGITLTLLKANETTPETATLTMSQDNAAVKNKVKEFMGAFNGLVDFIKQNSAFDKETFQSGLLFGDGTVQSVEATLASSLFNPVQGLSSSYTNLAQLGFTFESSGKLKLDETILDTALNTNPEAVGKVFRATGETTVDTLSYVSSTGKTKSSGTGAYSVVINQVATKGVTQAGIAQTGASGETETLTFNGSLFGNTSYNLLLNLGNDLQASVNQINNDSKLKDLVTASIVDGKLNIESKRYGTSGNFTVYSNRVGSTSNTGIGPEGGSEGTTRTAGVDVTGTINGEAATGSGQFLTGNTGNATTEGLQIQYTGSTTGPIGSIKFAVGIGAFVNGLIGQYNDSVNGLMTGADKSLQDQITSIEESITAMQERLKRKEEQLKRRFLAMEQAVTAMQQQSARLGAMSARG